ncbi:MAG: hypothetical protein Kow0029_13290 [Candidatus Rifleibacteriota bacterium]
MNKFPVRGGICSSDKFFQSMTYFAPAAILLLTHDGYIRNINPMGCKIFETSKCDAVGKHLIEICNGQIIEEIDQIIQSFMEGRKKPIPIELVTQNGKTLTLSVEMYHCQEFCSDLQCLIAIFSNVTSLKKTEEALQRTLTERLKFSSLLVANTNVKYQSLIEASPNWVSLVDADGKILVINSSGQRILERKEDEVINIKIWDLFPKREAERFRTGFYKAVENRTIFQDELDIILNDRIKHLSVVCNPISDSTSLIRRAVVIISDVTARKSAELALKQTLDSLEERVKERTKQLEAANAELAKEIAARKEFEIQLKKSKEEAESANLAKSEFLANMSHEIRTPMNSVLGFINLLLNTELTEKQRDYALTVKSSGSLLVALIDDILDLSKIEANRLVLEKIPFSFGKMVKEIIRLFEPKAAEKGILLSLELDAFLLENQVLGDCQRIRQVMINLIGNAVKFTHDGYVKVKANCHRNDDGNFFIDFVVEDSGIGILQNDLPKIFGKFTQANSSTTRKYGGTGLGLAISKRLVNMMGGTLGCCSTIGKGSEFFFHIPFEMPTGQSLPENNDAATVATNRADINPGDYKILVVEDDVGCRKFAEQCLEEIGFRYESVSNGCEATEILHRKKYDLVIMDWCLPGWSGLAITKDLRKAPGPNQFVPIIAATARAMKGDREFCIKAGMNSYLSKPYSPEDLKKEIFKLIKPKK